MLLQQDRLDQMRENAKLIKKLAESEAAQEEFLNTASVTAVQVGNLEIHIHIRDHVIQVDEQSHKGGDDIGPNPVEMLLAAIAGCTEVNWIAYSSAFHLDVKRVEVDVEGIIDRRYILSGAESVPARLKTVKIISRVYADAPQQDIRRVYERVQKFCPVAGSLHPDIEKEYILEILPANE